MVISLENNLLISESTYLYFLSPFENFDIDLLELDLEFENNLLFDILYSYSIDNQNFSTYVIKAAFEIPDIYIQPVYISIFFRKFSAEQFNNITTLHITENIDNRNKKFIVNSIKYDSETISSIRLKTIYDIVNEYPKWNFYDNQQITINNWLKQCNAISEMYGHACIYFKTEALETNHTLANNITRGVVNIKKINILSPNNELPQDRNVYTEWDMPLQDDFIIHVVKYRFEEAFGLNKIPSEKDYLYLPIINKLFRVSAVQPKNGFMGKIGWWELFLAKYEDDETVSMSNELEANLSDIPEFTDALDELDIFKIDTVKSKETIDKKTVDEKKTVNQNYTNKLVDSTFYVSLKETEKLREFYDRRLEIVSINPGENSFPITMYNNTKIEKRTVALQYDLQEYTTKNKLSLDVTKSFQLSFNFVLRNRFVGEILDLINSDNLTIFSINNKRNLLELKIDQIACNVEWPIEENEFYNILIDFNFSQISFKLFLLNNKEKELIYQNIYIVSDIVQFNISKAQLFGGGFFISEILLNIDSNNILKDYCNPLMKMKQF